MNAAPTSLPAETGKRSGIRRLRDEVAKYFELYAIPAIVTPVGLRYRNFKTNQNPGTGANRIVFIPGVFDGSETPRPRRYGNLSRESTHSGFVRNPDELLSWAREITISIWAAPVPGAVEDEDASAELAEDLLELVVRAVRSASAGGLSLAASTHWGAVTIVAPPNERAFGYELLVSLTQDSPIMGESYEVVEASIKPSNPTFVDAVGE